MPIKEWDMFIKTLCVAAALLAITASAFAEPHTVEMETGTVPGFDGGNVSLLSQPGVLEELERQKDIAADRAWKAEQRAWTRRQQARQLAVEEARKMGFADGDAQTPKTREQFLSAGGSELAYGEYIAAFTFASEAQANPLPTNPLGMKEIAELESDLSTGALGLEALPVYKDRLTSEDFSRLLQAAKKRDLPPSFTRASHMGLLDGTFQSVKTLEQFVDAGGVPEYYPEYMRQAEFASRLKAQEKQQIMNTTGQ